MPHKREKIKLAVKCFAKNDEENTLAARALNAHASFFECLPKVAIYYRVSREIVDARESHILDFSKPMPHATAGVSGIDTANDWYFFYHWQDFIFSNIHGDLV